MAIPTYTGHHWVWILYLKYHTGSWFGRLTYFPRHPSDPPTQPLDWWLLMVYRTPVSEDTAFGERYLRRQGLLIDRTWVSSASLSKIAQPLPDRRELTENRYGLGFRLTSQRETYAGIYSLIETNTTFSAVDATYNQASLRKKPSQPSSPWRPCMCAALISLSKSRFLRPRPCHRFEQGQLQFSPAHLAYQRAKSPDRLPQSSFMINQRNQTRLGPFSIVWY